MIVRVSQSVRDCVNSPLEWHENVDDNDDNDEEKEKEKAFFYWPLHRIVVTLTDRQS